MNEAREARRPVCIWGRILPLFLLWVAAPAPLYIWAALWLVMRSN